MSTLLVADETHESKVLFARAIEMISRNRADAAMDHLEEALQIAPNNASYLSHYGLCLAIVKQQYENARRTCERALRMAPEDPVTHVNLGKVYRLQGDNAEAHKRFIKAWKTNKSHPGPATELSRMGIRRPPVLPFLPRSHWLNIRLGRMRSKMARGLAH